MVSYLVPVVALFWGLVDGETIFFLQIIGMILILFGIYISRK
jgi:drug/metabolite transporter (DMT)-like permease